MFLIYLSGTDISPQKIELLNKKLDEALAGGNPELSAEDKILIIPNASTVTDNKGKNVVCMDIRTSPYESKNKKEAVASIIQAHLLLSSRTQLVITDTV